MATLALLSDAGLTSAAKRPPEGPLTSQATLVLFHRLRCEVVLEDEQKSFRNFAAICVRLPRGLEIARLLITPRAQLVSMTEEIC
jgi:hypothetical protein